jgi:hypothetical protein
MAAHCNQQNTAIIPKQQRIDYQDHISFQKEYIYYIGVMHLCISHIMKHKEGNICTPTLRTDDTFLCIEATINTIDYSSTIDLAT